MDSLYAKLNEIEHSGQKAALCTVVGSKGSTPRKPGAKMIVLSGGSVRGTVGGGELEFQVIRDALGVIETGKARVFSHALVHDHGMCCGGSIDIFIEPVVTRKKVYIFGAGHIGKALAELGADLGFAVTLIDERGEMKEEVARDDVRFIGAHHSLAFGKLEFDEETLVCVITHDHAYDREIVAHCAVQPHAYLGMIGSQRKVEVAKKTFRAGKILTEAQMEAIDWPMGVPIACETPKEIAVSILARLIDVRCRLDGRLPKTKPTESKSHA